MKVTRDTLKRIIKEELEEMMADQPLQKTTRDDITQEISNFHNFLTQLVNTGVITHEAYKELGEKLSDLQTKFNYFGH